MSEPPAPLAGWDKWSDDEPFEEMTGPFFMKIDDDGVGLSAFLCGPQHMNGGGFLHGGLLMTFADYALFVIAYNELSGNRAVTVSCQTEFLRASAPIGEIVYAQGEVTRDTRSLIFIRGHIEASHETVATFNGIVKKVGNRSASAN